jgi:ABC-type glutathione transport system ATPase component
MTATNHKLLQVEGLTVDFDAGKPTAHRALDGVSLSIAEGEVLGLVGESGSGKTVLSHSILGLLPSNGRVSSGRILWKGRELQKLSEKELRPIRGKEIAMIFQDPQASLNPVYPVGKQIEWVLKLHRDITGPEAENETLRLFESVKLRDPKRVARSYPHELSGGMCQRVMIAMALACQPLLLIADEPTSALDVKTQIGIIDLLNDIRNETPIAILFVSHDLRTIRNLCSEVVVMNQGTASKRHQLTENGEFIGLDDFEKLLHCSESPRHAGSASCEYPQEQAPRIMHTLQHSNT